MAKKKAASSGTPALQLLDRLGIEHVAHSYDHDPAETNFGDEAARKLAVTPERVFKTLVASIDGQLTVGVVPVTGMLDLKALAKAVGGKRAELADTTVAERKTGYVVGGISPLGQKTALPTVIDESAFSHPTVFVSGGRRGLDLELSADDLQRATGAVRAPIGKA